MRGGLNSALDLSFKMKEVRQALGGYMILQGATSRRGKVHLFKRWSKKYDETEGHRKVKRTWKQRKEVTIGTMDKKETRIDNSRSRDTLEGIKIDSKQIQPKFIFKIKSLNVFSSSIICRSLRPFVERRASILLRQEIRLV